MTCVRMRPNSVFAFVMGDIPPISHTTVAGRIVGGRWKIACLGMQLGFAFDVGGIPRSSFMMPVSAEGICV